MPDKKPTAKRREYKKQYAKRWNESHREWWKAKRLEAWAERHGLSLTEALSIYVEQDGRCSICRRQLTVGTRSADNNGAVIDHHHATNLVRGILCNRCNVGPGMFEDNPDRLLAAVAYLGGVR